jgi:tetratricopeptide (TPR) repeat protein
MGERIAEFWRAGSWWKAAQTDIIRQRAKALEEAGELTMALDHWLLIEHIVIDQTHARREVRRLKGKIAEAVQTHYQLGLDKMKAREAIAARNHFLAALRLDPSFQPARLQLKAGFSPFPLAGYYSVPGDRPQSIAQKKFGDEEKAFLVTWFNDLPGDAPIAPHTLLILPKLEKEPIKKKPKKKPPNRLDEARARFSKGDLEGALGLSRQLNADDAAVQTLVHEIHLKQAMIQTEDGRLDEAHESLALIPDGFAGKDAAQDGLQAALNQRQLALDLADAHRRYADHDFKGSLDLATAVLAQAPQNTDASHLADDARYHLALDFFDHRQFIEARTVLEHADDAHSPSVALREKVTKQLVALAQMHYRNGVKLFINEQLQAAVDEWQKALKCDPDHAKARENIDNARRIMQKIERLP